MLRAARKSIVACLILVGGLQAQESVALKPNVEASPGQVQIQIRLLSLNRTKLQAHEYEIDDNGRLIRLEKALNQNRLQISDGPTPTTSMAVDPVTDDEAVERVLVDWRDRLNVLTVIAEPTLVTLDGREAEFHSGGWLDVPVPQAGGAFKSERWRLGTICDIRPLVIDSDRINLEIACRYRRTDPTRDVLIGQTRVPTISHDFDVKLTSQVQSGRANIIRGLVQKRVVDGELVETESLLIYRATLVSAATQTK
jgi:pilus assembly protein CpaC